MYFPIVGIPKFRTLKLRIPLAELITNRKYSFLCSCFFFITTCTANAGIEFKFFYSIEQSICLKLVTAGEFPFLLGEPFCFYSVLYLTDNQFCSDTVCKFISEIK